MSPKPHVLKAQSPACGALGVVEHFRSGAFGEGVSHWGCAFEGMSLPLLLPSHEVSDLASRLDVLPPNLRPKSKASSGSWTGTSQTVTHIKSFTAVFVIVVER